MGKMLAYLIVIGMFVAAYLWIGKSLLDKGKLEEQRLTQTLRMEDPGISEYEIAATKITRRLESLMGTPYRFGSADPATGGVDCSGLLRIATVLAGYPTARTNTKGMWMTWEPVDEPEMGAVGIFFRNNRPVHVGYWVAPPEMIHASSSKGVERRDIHSQGGYWSRQLNGHRLIPSIAHLREKGG